ncbi:unnamed protein product [Dicrocoelium dendriticum]|nr:unnamed protein product [Dicrocoelium dendriticum]
MIKLSFTNALLFLGLGYFLFTAWTLVEVFFPAACQPPATCLMPAWNPEDQVSLEVTFLNHPGEVLLKTGFFPIASGLENHQSLVPPSDVFNNKTVEARISLSNNAKFIFSIVVPLTIHKEPVRTAFNLLGGKDESTALRSPSSVEQTSVNFWLSTLHIYLLSSAVGFNRHSVPPELIPHLKVIQAGSHTLYQPLIYSNPVMQKSTDWIQVPAPTIFPNGTMQFPEMPFSVSIKPQTIGKFRLRCMLGSMAEQLRSYGFRSKDIDEVRQLLVDTNFYFLLTTMFVSVFHLLFDFLAFKNDISFWRKMKNTTGLSTRTVVWRFLSSLIIFLHLREERSSLLVTIPMGISTLIEFWKLLRLTKCSFSLRHGFRRGARSVSELETDKLDAQFTFWLQCVMVPLCLAGSVYSLLYTPHRSWYSWCLETLVHGVYAFGFLFMTPQLFINYRLKSVAHLPWKALTYKAFNTFIDDFFAMIITMPTSHRIACLRDDVIFLIYLYQRCLYPVDKSRINEFGQRGDDEPTQHSSIVHPTASSDKIYARVFRNLLPSSWTRYHSTSKDTKKVQ